MVRGYRGSYSRASSESSELTRGESGEVSSEEEEMTSSVYSTGKEKMSTEWTDEKHSLYLKSMEASFVDQLYNSLGIGSHGNKKNKLDEGSSRWRCGHEKPSEEQFKVLRAGFWERMDVKQSEYCFNRSDASHKFLASPWIKHFRPLSKAQSPGRVISNPISASTTKQVRDIRDQINNGEEASDQNFINETEDEKASSPSSSKKMKIGITESSSNDQVVPYGKSPAT